MGTKAFSTTSLTATIIATWASGSGFNIDLESFYFQGWVYAIPALGMCFSLLFVAVCFVPKMARVLNKISVAAIMGDQYGQTVRTITAISGCLVVLGYIFIQFKIMGLAINYIIPSFDPFTCIALSSIVVIIYSSIGGINSVVHTDRIQMVCFTFAILIGITCMYTKLYYTTSIPPVAAKHFEWSYIYTLDKDTLLDTLLLFLYFTIPAFSPHVIQRISMGFSINQVKKSYIYAFIGLSTGVVLSYTLAYLFYQLDPNVLPEDIFHSFIDQYAIPGTKGILIIGVVCMCMSTADSNLNIAAILIANDLPFFKSKSPIEKLNIARCSTIFLGVISVSFYLYKGTLLNLILFAHNFYTPIVTAPLMALILGYNLSKKTCLIAMSGAFTLVLICNFVIKTELNINTIALCVNAVLLILAHNFEKYYKVAKLTKS